MRSVILKIIACLTIAAVTTPLAAADRPNILFAIADDWGWPHASVLGEPVIQTPTFDRLAKEGVLFNHTYVATPSCTASRGAILTGQAIHRLEVGGNLWSRLPAKFEVYPDLLEEAGYTVGYTRKGWGPGTIEGTGRTRNPAGPRFKDLAAFLETVPEGKPFCFWFGSFDPHRGYKLNSGADSGMKLADVRVPAFLPDTPVVRGDVCDYFFEVQRFDREVGEMLALLKKAGKLDNTIVVMTGDHGMPFPRAKTNLYDSGARVAMAVRWPEKVKPGRTVDDFVSFTDFAPTFLEAAGLKPLEAMTGRSFFDLLVADASGRIDPKRDRVIFERERHTVCRPDRQSYPVRAIRTHEFLYKRNLRPHLWPAGDPEAFRDCDGSPSKTEILKRRTEPAIAPFFELAFAKRPAEELYDLKKDPDQLHNVAGRPEYAAIQKQLRADLDRWMTATADPRATGEVDLWDTCQYMGR